MMEHYCLRVKRTNSKYLTWMRYILIFCDIWSFITTSIVDDHVCKIYIPNNYIYLIPEFYFFKCNVSKLTIIFSLQYIFSQKIINKKSFCVLDLHFLFHEFTFSFVPTNVHKIQNVPTHNDNWNGTWQCLAQIKTTPRIFIHKMKIIYIDFIVIYLYGSNDHRIFFRITYAQRCDISHDEVAPKQHITWVLYPFKP